MKNKKDLNIIIALGMKPKKESKNMKEDMMEIDNYLGTKKTKKESKSVESKPTKETKSMKETKKKSK